MVIPIQSSTRPLLMSSRRPRADVPPGAGFLFGACRPPRTCFSSSRCDVSFTHPYHRGEPPRLPTTAPPPSLPPVLFSKTTSLQPKRNKIKIQLLFRKTKLCFFPAPLPHSSAPLRGGGGDKRLSGTGSRCFSWFC